MVASLSETIITPSVLSTTMTGCKCSEIFLMNEDRTESFTDVIFKTMMSGWAPALGVKGPLVRINSEGWSTLLVWEIYDATDRGSTTTPISSMVMGQKPAFNSTATAEGVLDGEGNAYVNTATTTIAGSTGLFTWEPCRVISGRPNTGRISSSTSNDPVSPPMGCHSSGNVFTFAKGPIFNNTGNTSGNSMQPDKEATEVKFSATDDTYMSGPAVIDVTSTTQILHLPIFTPSTDEPGYFVGQFIS